jgi:hypothetical protein
MVGKHPIIPRFDAYLTVNKAKHQNHSATGRLQILLTVDKADPSCMYLENYEE